MEEEGMELNLELIQRILQSGMFSMGGADDDEGDATPILSEVNGVEGVAKLIAEGRARNIIVMAGAGVSTAAGIPDFRTPGTGIYDQLGKYNLPDPSCMFEIGFFKEHPEPFIDLAKALYPGTFPPTLTHCFIRLLDEKGLLLRTYTQNIDNLERIVGVTPSKLVEAHGTFALCHCITCKRAVPETLVKASILAGTIPRCKNYPRDSPAEAPAEVAECEGLVKPDIVFFGEPLPRFFFERMGEDMPKCDLLIVMGTSLKVHPFASLATRVPPRCPRLLINRERVGESPELPAFMTAMGLKPKGFDFDHSLIRRDALFLGDCDAGCRALCQALGGDWEQRLDEIYAATRDLTHASLNPGAAPTALSSSPSL